MVYLYSTIKLTEVYTQLGQGSKLLQHTLNCTLLFPAVSYISAAYEQNYEVGINASIHYFRFGKYCTVMRLGKVGSFLNEICYVTASNNVMALRIFFISDCVDDT